jgi:hypothetical protein
MKSMLSRKAFGAALLGLAGVAIAQAPMPGRGAPGTAQPAAPPVAAPAKTAPARVLEPRVALPKHDQAKLAVAAGTTTGRLIVKFRDEVQARPGKDVQSVAAADLSGFNAIAAAQGLTVTSAFSLSPERLKKIEAKVGGISGKAQPDLAGMMYVERAGGVPLAAAQAINSLAEVEFVEYEPTLAVHGGPGACCLPNISCVITATPADCVDLGGAYQGDGTTCGAGCGACCVPQPDGSIQCQDDGGGGVVSDKCTGIGGVFQGAGSNCTAVDCEAEPDCGEPGTGDCFLAHGSPFCSNDDCCQLVCTIDPFCCDDDGSVFWPGRGPGTWDQWCADHALELLSLGVADCVGAGALPCPPGQPVNDPDDPTPNFTDAQGYLTPCPYTDQFAFDPTTCAPPAVPNDNIAPALQYDAVGAPALLPGYTGEGYDLDGVWFVGDILVDLGLATQNLSRGKSIKAGVIEYAAFVASAMGPDQPYEHEDLTHVVTEEGDNRFLIIPGGQNSDGNHGTATLGIIGALNNQSDGTLRPEEEPPADSLTDQRGMVGVAPDADLYFFSIATLAGKGTLDAIARALDEDGADFGPGDVLNFSIGPIGCGTLASSAGAWVMLNAATQGGVTCVLSAGNECCNLDGSPQAFGLDSGVTIVGACLPGASGGFNWCRLPFSNYCQDCEAPSAVHVAAWGEAVASLGYGDLFAGTSNNADNRSYTNTFNGTSASAPQVAGLIACFQGLSKMKWGIPLSPTSIRSMMRNEILDVNFLACGIGANQTPGSSGTAVPCLTSFPPCLGAPARSTYSNADWDTEGTDNFIGLYTDAFQCAKLVVANSWFEGNPNLGSIEVLEGELIFGNVFSIAASDDNHLVIQSKTSTPSGPGVSDRGNIAVGKTTDLKVEFNSSGATVTGFQVQVESHVTGAPVFMLVYLYNWDQLQWMIGGVAVVDGIPNIPRIFQIGNPQPFINDASNEVHVRVWTVLLGVGPQYRVFHDRIAIEFSGNQFVPGG